MPGRVIQPTTTVSPGKQTSPTSYALELPLCERLRTAFVHSISKTLGSRARVECATTLDKQDFAWFLQRYGAMLYTTRHYNQFHGAQVDVTLAEAHAHNALHNKEALVLLFVVVPHKFALHAGELDLAVVHIPCTDADAGARARGRYGLGRRNGAHSRDRPGLGPGQAVPATCGDHGSSILENAVRRLTFLGNAFLSVANAELCVQLRAGPNVIHDGTNGRLTTPLSAALRRSAILIPSSAEPAEHRFAPEM